MRRRWNYLLFFLVLMCVSRVSAAGEPELQVRASKPGGIVTVEREIDDGKVLVSVSDAAKNPMFGLTVSDFVVTKDGRTARITSAQPVSESLEVPRNIVLLLDNSASMQEREAVRPLLAGVDELLKIVRPIDQVQVVVFGREEMSMGGRDLRVRTFKSNSPAELKNFVAEVYRDGMTLKTVLHEGMLAGLEFIRTLPANEPRFMVVFSDGEDLNSAFNADEVLKATEGLARFNAYAIDYMPGPETDKFLKKFAEDNHGQIWKATSETSLVPIFQSVASKMQYYYVVTYLFPTTGSLAVAPSGLNIDEIEDLGASSRSERAAGAASAKSASVISRIDTSSLSLSPVVDTAYGIARWKVTLANTGGTLAEQAGEGTPPAEIVVPLKTDDLGRLAAGGDIKATMEVQDRKGQNIVLTAPAVKVNYFKTTGSLTVAPASVTIEEIKTIDASPMLGHIYFSRGSSEIAPQYVRVAGPEAVAAFDEHRFRDTLEKYHQVLNIIGKRMVDHPEAVVMLTGCNDNMGPEKGNLRLSSARAEAVRDYLRSVWNIAPGRIGIETRNLPKMPSTSRLEEGQADNRRVEISSEHPAIMDLVRSTYFTTKIDTAALTLQPVVTAPHGVSRWTVTAANSTQKLGEKSGEGAPPAEIKLPLTTNNLNDMATAGDIKATMEVQDRKGQKLAMAANPVRVNSIRSSQLMAQKQGFRVQEKYALILFDFDSDLIDARNQAIVNAIVARIRALPQATVDIVGHSDNIGKEDYNIKLSERRALAVNKLLTEAYGGDLGGRLRHSGVGPNNPLYDNTTSEARSFNRTVTITLEYMADN